MLDCERERGTRRWSPQAQALIELVTAQFTRGARISCACQGDRHVSATGGGRITIFRAANRADEPPPLPLETTIDAFCRDSAHDEDVLAGVLKLRAGESVRLPGLGYPVCMTELNPVQAWGLYELPRANGLHGMVSVGAGKTAIGILAPLAIPRCRTVVLLAKSIQRLHYQKQYLRLREHFRISSIVFDQANMRGSYWVEGTPVLHFIPYSQLSNPKSTLMLEMLNPDMVIADESHLLSNKAATRTMRWLRLMSKREDIVFCNWSGSMIKKSMKDGSHLAAHALGIGSPYPIMPNDVEAWASVLDPTYIPDTESNIAKGLYRAFAGTEVGASGMKALPGMANVNRVREGHRDRIIRTPGVISTRSSSVTASISLRERKIAKMPQGVYDTLALARGGMRADGEELAEKMDIVECARAAAAGYYHVWVYPEATDEDMAEGGLIDRWFEARKPWNKELRNKLLNGEPHLDSMLLCYEAAKRAWQSPPYDGNLPVWPAESWPAWAEIEHCVKYKAKTKWIEPDGDFLAKDAAEWAKKPDKHGKFGIVWVQSPDLGRLIAKLAGIQYHGGGASSEEKILAENGSRSIVASLKVHGESLDGLQYKFYRQLLTEVPPSSDKWEQFLGRLAREGQSADTVETDVYQHVKEYRDAYRSARMYAEHVEATTPNRQLLLAADSDF